MTFGEKIREARRKRGMSQEQLAKRMVVSRSAVAKWETDKGLPDVGNLKVLARLLCVSVDHLLDETELVEESVFRESYNLASYGYGCGRVKKDRAVRDRFPDAVIYPLLGRQEVWTQETFADHVPSCGSGNREPADRGDKVFYLIEKDGQQFFVAVADAFMEIRPMEQPVHDTSFTMDGWHFIRRDYEMV